MYLGSFDSSVKRSSFMNENPSLKKNIDNNINGLENESNSFAECYLFIYLIFIYCYILIEQ
jgi:hypothetical protein